MAERRNKVLNYNVNDALEQMSKSEYGAHYIMIYPNLDALRELYSNYVHKQIERNNEIVLINPFYETTDSVRQALSRMYNDNINEVSKHEQQKSLIIADALERYFGEQNMDDKSFKINLVNNAKKIGKNGLSILCDMGAYHHKSKHEELVDYELSLPTKYDVQMKGFCLYHQKDFDKFSEQQQQKLIEHHHKTLEIIHN